MSSLRNHRAARYLHRRRALRRRAFTRRRTSSRTTPICGAPTLVNISPAVRRSAHRSARRPPPRRLRPPCRRRRRGPRALAGAPRILAPRPLPAAGHRRIDSSRTRSRPRLHGHMQLLRRARTPPSRTPRSAPGGPEQLRRRRWLRQCRVHDVAPAEAALSHAPDGHGESTARRSPQPRALAANHRRASRPLGGAAADHSHPGHRNPRGATRARCMHANQPGPRATRCMHANQPGHRAIRVVCVNQHANQPGHRAIRDPCVSTNSATEPPCIVPNQPKQKTNPPKQRSGNNQTQPWRRVQRKHRRAGAVASGAPSQAARRVSKESQQQVAGAWAEYGGRGHRAPHPRSSSGYC